jgi:hypothetical protein
VGVEHGSLAEVESCFRGKSVLAPKKEMAEDPNINLINTRINKKNDSAVDWTCETFRNISTLHPQTSSLILEVEGDMDTALSFDINGKHIKRTIKELLENGMSDHMKPYSSEAFKIHTAVPQSKYCVGDSFVDKGPEAACDIYHLEVLQYNGQAAYVSPVYVESI